jgi:hypothetical protein
MKKFSLYLITAAALAAGLSSCKKELDLQPTDTFNENNAYLNLTEVQYGLNAAYGRYTAYINDMYVSALLSDEAKLGPDNSGQGALTFRYQYASDNTSGGDVTSAWGDYFSIVDQVNRLLPKIDQVSTSSSEEAQRKSIRGQLLALRGVANFGLVQAYCKNYSAADPKGIPIMLESNPLAKPARKTVGESVAQIEKDLFDARVLLSSSSFTETEMNKFNIPAFQARVALYKGDLNAAKNFALDVIGNVPTHQKDLVSGVNFSNMWTDTEEGPNEILFKIKNSLSSSVGSLWTTTSDFIYISPSDKLSNIYEASDVRKDAYIAEDQYGSRYVNKFYTSDRGARVVDIKVCRISEMYFIVAEACAKTNKLDSANFLLNKIRKARIPGYVDQTYTSESQMMEEILDERLREFAFEGMRFWDLKRNRRSVIRSASDAEESWRTMPANSYRFILPIPNDEILANPNMVQNDNY